MTLKSYLESLIVTNEGCYRLDTIYEQNVGERAPQNSGRMLEFFLGHYANYPEDLPIDFPGVSFIEL